MSETDDLLLMDAWIDYDEDGPDGALPPVEFPDAFAKRETAKALLVVIDGSEHWIPKSQIHADSEVYEDGHRGKLVITAWLAEQKGLG